MTKLAFSAEEFEGRLRRIRKEMGGRGLKLLILTRGENIFYASGYRASHFASWLSELHALVIPAVGAPRLMARALERGVAEQQWTREPRLYNDHEDPYALLRAIVDETGGPNRIVGLEERFLKVSQLRRIKDALPAARFSDASGLVERVATVPSEAEVTCMQEAARITEVGLQAGIEMIAEGVTTGRIIGRMHEAMYRAGQRDFDMALVCVWSGPEGGLMHDTRSDRKMRSGDVATVEVWGVDNHYKAGAQASVFVGSNPARAIVEAYGLTAAMHVAARDAVRGGSTAGEIFEAASTVYRAARGADYYRRCGGSMGLTVFTVDLVRDRSDVLVPGMCLLIQTLVDDPVLLTCASTIMVTEDGYVELTRPLLELKSIAAT